MVSAFLKELSTDFKVEAEKKFKKSLLKPKSMKTADLLKLASYYSFAVVRDPYSRALSGFLNKVASGKNSREFGNFAGFGNSTQTGFLEFLTYLDAGALYKDRHFWPQSELLFQPVEHFSYIAKLETLVQDMKTILSEIGHDPAYADVLARPHKVEAGSSKITSANSKMAHYYSLTSVELVRKLYAKDFEQFDYPMFPGPIFAEQGQRHFTGSPAKTYGRCQSNPEGRNI